MRIVTYPTKFISLNLHRRRTPLDIVYLLASQPIAKLFIFFAVCIRPAAQEIYAITCAFYNLFTFSAVVRENKIPSTGHTHLRSIEQKLVKLLHRYNVFFCVTKCVIDQSWSDDSPPPTPTST